MPTGWNASRLKLLALALVPALAFASPPDPTQRIAETPGGNRAFVITNKAAAHFYTQTHVNDHPEHAYFRGSHIAGRRIFNDIILDGGRYDPRDATIIAYPYELERKYPDGLVERIGMVDGRDVLEVGLYNAPIPGLELRGDHLRQTGEFTYVATQDDGRVDYVHVQPTKFGYNIAVGGTPDEAARAAAVPVDTYTRATRIIRLAEGIGDIDSDDRKTRQALRWLIWTTDALVTKQRGEGIYAGLPWFPEYWGRDQFISLRGATLVTGQFETAAEILRSFAKFQDHDPASKFYGRMPNIVKADSLDYHTTDGTPRFVMSLRDYVDYTGDVALVRELFPAVQASIDGSLRNWTDGKGFLTHASNETWMDARREPDKVAYVDRSNRANDIQALWFAQLRDGAALAKLIGQNQLATQWLTHAAKVSGNFAKDFVDPSSHLIADHLTAQDRRDMTLRPNALFALNLVGEDVARRQLRESWSRLVFPWGVATLDPRDGFFHPYHFAPERWHKDSAYHNGTVWPWLDGIAMQRMIEFGEQDKAWRLFAFNNDMALTRGTFGGLAETMDAYPHPGEEVPRLTGTFLQAWSNAEQLRTWYQGFLGVQPRYSEGYLRLAPRMPTRMKSADITVRLREQGKLRTFYFRNDETQTVEYTFGNLATKVVLDIPPFAPHTFNAPANSTWTAVTDTRTLKLYRGGKLMTTLRPDSKRQRTLEDDREFFRDVDFAKVNPAKLDAVPVSPLPPLSEKTTSP